MSKEEITAIAEQIADQLGETQRLPRKRIADVIRHAGADFARQAFNDATEVEANGGILTKNGKRRRTYGGVFFYLVKQRLTPEMRKTIFPYRPFKNQNKTSPSTPAYPAFVWAERLDTLNPLLNSQGEVYSVKVTLIGRPGPIEHRRDVVITTMSHTHKSATLPRGVPNPPSTPTVYTVYIATKQWSRVQDAIQNPEDSLIIEGTCAYDAEIGAVAVFTTNVTSKQLEAKKRQQKQAQEVNTSGGGVSAAPKSPQSAQKPSQAAKKSSQAPKSAPPPPVLPPAPAPVIPPGVPADVAQKLTELHASAVVFRQKIAALEAKPEGQRFGLEMTQRLLTNVEGEIRALEQQYES